MAFTIKVGTNEEAYALRKAMIDLATEQGRVTEGDIFKMLDLSVAENEKDSALYWALGKLNQIQIRAVADGSWCIMLPQPDVPEDDNDVHPCDTTVEKNNMSPDELELRVRITDAINGKYSDTTIVTIDYIDKRLQAAYSRGLKYDISDLREHVMRLAEKSPIHRDRCCKAVEQMRFKSDGHLVEIRDEGLTPIEENKRLRALVGDLYESDDKMVSHPPHYQSESGLEVINVIKAFTEGLSGIVATDAGNIIKYACRWHKKNGVQDLKKILWYTQHLINELEKKEDISNE